MGALIPWANGFVVREGRSTIDGSPIVVVMVGLKADSTNGKTGGMVQTYILRADMPPTEAKREGLDGAVCGACPLRSVASGGSGACYVNVGQGPRAVWDAWRRGKYPTVTPWEAADLLRGRKLRIGSYGDPAAVPFAGIFWRTLLTYVVEHTGYTHRWRDVGADLRGVCMASVDSAAEATEAMSYGWATFRVARKGDRRRLDGEAYCPAATESGKRTTCADCPIKCNGSRAIEGLAGRVIQAHGATGGRVKGD